MAENIYLSFKRLDGYEAINMETCTRCGACANSCPAYLPTHDDYAVPAWKSVQFRRLLNHQRGFLSAILGQRPVPREWLRSISAKGLYLCTLCGRCMPGCVFTIQNLELWEKLRSIVFEEHEASPNLMKVSDSLERNRNPYDYEHTDRLSWVKEPGLENLRIGQRAETVYYVGCTSSYQEKGMASSTARILTEMNEDWSLFGHEEWCCGDPHIAVGDQEKAKEFAQHNLEIALSLGARKIVTSCAHCYRMWKWRYPQLLGKNHNLEIMHTTEYLQKCVDSGSLKLEKISGKVTFHDPCNLSRLGGVVNEPRNVLGEMSNDYVEMRERMFDTFCCGGGGMTETANKDLWIKIADERFRQAKTIDPELLVSACPFCRRALTQAAERSRSNIRVLDITELVAKQLKD